MAWVLIAGFLMKMIPHCTHDSASSLLARPHCGQIISFASILGHSFRALNGIGIFPGAFQTKFVDFVYFLSLERPIQGLMHIAGL
jgi:hypothetical protein